MEWKSVCFLHLCHPSRASPAGTRLGHASDRGCSAAICRISETPSSRRKNARVIVRDPKTRPTTTPLPKPTQVPAGLAAFTALCGLPPSSSYRRLSLRDIILVYSKVRLWGSLLRFLLHPHKFFQLPFYLDIINPQCVLVYWTFSNLCFGYLCFAVPFPFPFRPPLSAYSRACRALRRSRRVACQVLESIFRLVGAGFPAARALWSRCLVTASSASFSSARVESHRTGDDPSLSCGVAASF
jgi:hypothetical protein